MSNTEKRKVNSIDSTGLMVARNIKRLRGDMSLVELSARLRQVGRVIQPLILGRIESGERKVDVDDLMAFAIVFNVSPLTLLLPESGSAAASVKITGTSHEYGSNILWLWGRGDEPLDIDAIMGDEYGGFITRDDKIEGDIEYKNKVIPYTSEQERKIFAFSYKAKPIIEPRKTGLLKAFAPPEWQKVSLIEEQGLQKSRYVSYSLRKAARIAREIIEQRKSAQTDKKD